MPTIHFPGSQNRRHDVSSTVSCLQSNNEKQVERSHLLLNLINIFAEPQSSAAGPEIFSSHRQSLHPDSTVSSPRLGHWPTECPASRSSRLHHLIPARSIARQALRHHFTLFPPSDPHPRHCTPAPPHHFPLLPPSDFRPWHWPAERTAVTSGRFQSSAAR